MIVDNFVRLLAVQDFYAELSRLDEEATLARMRTDFTPNLEILLTASTIIAAHGGMPLLRTLRSDVRRLLASADLRLLGLAEQAAVARAFQDCLDEDMRASLTLPWAMHAVLLDTEAIEDLWDEEDPDNPFAD